MKHLLSAAFAAALALGAQTAGATELRLAHFLSPNHPYHPQMFQWWADRVAEESGGDITVRIYPAGELGQGPSEQYGRAIDGVADVAFFLHGYTPGDTFPLTLISELPGVIPLGTDPTQGMNRAAELYAPEYRRTHVLANWMLPEAVLFTRDTRVESLADVQGMKIRVGTPTAGALVESWGAVPIFAPATEVYTNMQTGVVDGVLITASGAQSFNLTEVARYVITGFDSTPTAFGLTMNRDSYAALGAEGQAAIDRASAALVQHASDVSGAMTQYGMDYFLGGEGHEEVALSPEAAAEFRAASSTITAARIAELEGRGLPAQAVADAMGAGE